MKYRLEDGKILDSDLAVKSWEEAKDLNGNNHAGRSTGSQWQDETLYLSRRGRYWLERCSRVQGQRSSAQVMTKQEAIAWLALNDHELPPDLAQDVVE